MIVNYSSMVGFVISVLCLLVYIIFLTPKQIDEVLQPKDGLTKLRYVILAILIFTIITSLPSTAYQFMRALGTGSGRSYLFFQNLTTITANISKLGTTILLVFVYTYRRKD